MSSAACGPWSSAIATARLRATTGVGVVREQLVVERDDLRPVGRRVGVDGVDRGLQLVRAGLVAAQQAADERVALRDLGARPRAHGPGRRAARAHPPLRARGAAGVGQQQQREQAEHLGLVGHQLGQQAREPDRLRAQVLRASARQRSRVALVEDQVDDREHRLQPRRQVGLARHAVGDPRVADLALGAHQPLRHRRLGHEERARDLGRAQPAEQPQRERDLRGGRERRMAAGEDQPQAVVVHRARLLRLAGRSQRGLLLLRRARRLAAEAVDPAVARGRDDPARRARRQHRSRGQRRTASVKASWTASSAASMSPKWRTRTATARPYSSRKTRSTSTSVLDGADLDRQRMQHLGVAARPTRARRRGPARRSS